MAGRLWWGQFHSVMLYPSSVSYELRLWNTYTDFVNKHEKDSFFKVPRVADCLVTLALVKRIGYLTRLIRHHSYFREWLSAEAREK